MIGNRDQVTGIRAIGIALMAMVLLGFATPALASNICIYSSGCTAGEVGPFMAGISQACGNLGTCYLGDIMTVFHNIGNWVLGIVGAVVFLMYIYGGFMLILGGAGSENVKKGKQALKISTTGLVIVFVAYAAIQTLYAVLDTGSLPEGNIEYVVCGPGSANAGKACGPNQICSDEGTCMTECEQTHPATEGGDKWACVDTADPFSTYTTGSCETGLCPGGNAVQCCIAVEAP